MSPVYNLEQFATIQRHFPIECSLKCVIWRLLCECFLSFRKPPQVANDVGRGYFYIGSFFYRWSLYLLPELFRKTPVWTLFTIWHNCTLQTALQPDLLTGYPKCSTIAHVHYKYINSHPINFWNVPYPIPRVYNNYLNSHPIKFSNGQSPRRKFWPASRRNTCFYSWFWKLRDALSKKKIRTLENNLEHSA